MNRQAVLACLIAALAASGAVAGDWPTYRHDNLRSAIIADAVDAAGLRLAWSWLSPHPPAPAWDGAATHDAYHGMRGFADTRDYDHAFHPVAAGGCVFFASSVDDSVRCLDAGSGREKWRFTADAAVRVAPTLADGKVYFGSDDGTVYCLAAADGAVVWKYNPVPGERRILHNGRPIAVRPCRTGVLVDKGVAYFAFSMLPWERTYLCALDAATGRPDGEGRFVRVCEPFSLEGPFALNGGKLFFPQGRSAGMTFDRATGKDLGAFGNGGSLVAFNADGTRLFFGPSNRAPSTGNYGGGRDMVAGPAADYVTGPRGLSAMTRQGGKAGAAWTQPLADAWAVAMAGQTVFAGGRDRVAAYAAADGKELWSAPVVGVVRGLALAGGQLIAATDEGHLFCFAPGGAAALPAPAAPAKDAGEPATLQSEPTPVRLPVGPYAQFIAPDKAVIRWETPAPSPSVVEFGTGQAGRKLRDDKPKTQHAMTLEGLKRNTEYRYLVRATVDGKERTTQVFPLDTFFNYTIRPIADAPAFTAAQGRDADRVLAAGISQGLCVILGGGQERLAYELARRSSLRVIIYDTDAAAVAAARAALAPTGAYGARVSVHLAASLDMVPLASDSADLVLVGRPGGAEATRLARAGGVVMLSVQALQHKPPRADAGVWSHQYGRADNATFGGEALAGAQTTRELGVQWIGRPGPRFQPDREPRKPAPLAINGRLFAQGLRRIVAANAHNGTILWSLEIPDFMRFNMPDDCSNWCADDDHVYAVVKDRCWQIDAATGRLVRTMPVQGEGEWGYVGREGAGAAARLVGSIGGGHALNFAGPGGWYDDAGSNKYTSHTLFAADPADGKTLWTYRKGAIINSTITLTPTRVFFVDAREGLWAGQFLVALNLADGKIVWETPLAGPGKSIVFHLAWSADRLVLMANAGYTYHVYAFDATDAGKGRQLWQQAFDGRGNHGGHMGRQGIVGDRVFARPKILDLASGKILGDMPTGGCGTYSFSRHAVFFRADHTTMWSFTSREGSNWMRLRPDCWLSTITACGLVLSPEASGGCWCGNWLETSIAFAPKADVPVFDTADMEFTGTLDVKFRAPLGGGAVHYTLDGTAPTASSAKVSGPVKLNDTALVRAVVVQEGRPGPETARQFVKINSKLATALTVTFQPPGDAPSGCVADHGERYGTRPSGFAYGWSEPMKQAIRGRRRQADPKLSNCVYFMPGVSWSVAVENGTYDVTVSVGDAAYPVRDGTVYVNGVELCKGVQVGEEDFKKFTSQVAVKDGRLTMSSHQKAAPSERTRINYVEFKKK